MELERYQELKVLGEGSYGVVYQCRNKHTLEMVAIKKMKNSNDYDAQKIFHREVKMLRELNHKNIVKLLEAIKKKSIIYLVFEFLECNLMEEIEKFKNGMDEDMVSNCTYQILSGLKHMHDMSIVHRDLKPENILIQNHILKICDFGFARKLDNERYTEYVATRWYRAPELLLFMPYNEKVDIFSLGCIVYEMRVNKPLLPGRHSMDQLVLISRNLGPLTSLQKNMFYKIPDYIGLRLPHANFVPIYQKNILFSNELRDFLDSTFISDPDSRFGASELLRTKFMRNYRRQSLKTTHLPRKVN